MLLQELKKFSRENWWIFILLAIASGIVIYTGRGNIFEILVLFFLNLFGNVAVMAAIGNYSEKKNKVGAIFHLTSTLVFTALAIYSFFVFDQTQYIIWQICFLIAAIKAITFYNFEKNLHFFNPSTVGILNVIFLGIFLFFGKDFGFNVGISSIIMAFGFSFVTTGLVSVEDNFRYWGNYIGSLLIVVGAAIGSYQSYVSGNLNGVDLGYFILTLTAFIYFSKLLPKYIHKKTKKS